MALLPHPNPLHVQMYSELLGILCNIPNRICLHPRGDIGPCEDDKKITFSLVQSKSCMYGTNGILQAFHCPVDHDHIVNLGFRTNKHRQLPIPMELLNHSSRCRAILWAQMDVSCARSNLLLRRAIFDHDPAASAISTPSSTYKMLSVVPMRTHLSLQ